MKLPFEREQFFAVFTRYNEAVWPAQVVLAALAVVAALLVWRPGRATNRVTGAVLAVLWIWMGAVYHFTFFRTINPAAVFFAAAFLLEGAAIAWFGVWRARLHFQVSRGPAGLAAGVMVVYALAVYPLIGQAAGHVYPAAPTFGLPCPTTIFTLGLLVAAGRTVPRLLWVVPFAWAAIGTVAAVQLGVVEDFGLPAAAIAAAVFMVGGRAAAPAAPTPQLHPGR